MKTERLIQTFGIMMLLGSIVGLVFAVIFTFIFRPVAEGLGATAFFVILTGMGYFMFKYDFREQGEINEKLPK